MDKVKNFQQLEDIATASWYGSVLFLAVEVKLFDLLRHPKTETELCAELSFTKDALHRFLRVLTLLDLVWEEGELVGNTVVSETYLVSDAAYYQGHSILWRKNLLKSWAELPAALKVGGRTVFSADSGEEAVRERFFRYTLAMDDIARCKAREIGACCKNLTAGRRVLDLGSGLGAVSRYFMEKSPKTTAVYCDMGEVLALCAELLPPEITARITFCSMNILDDWKPLKGQRFSLVVMSNIVHAFDAADNTALLTRVGKHLEEDGVVLIHDFFHDHMPPKAALLDMNMLINTFNGRVFSFAETERFLKDSGILYTKRIPLPSDTALLVASKSKTALERI